MRKSQYSMEFLIFFALLTFLFIIWLTVYSQLSQDAFDRRDSLAINDLGEAIESQIFLASSSHSGYKSTNLAIPNKAGPVAFEILNTNYVFYLRTEKQDYIFHIPYLLGTLKKGTNTLYDVNGVVVVEETFNPYISPKDLILLLHLDQSQGTTTKTFDDESGLDNHGTCSDPNCPANPVAGNGGFTVGQSFGNALVFTGNERLQIANEQNFDFTNDFTISLWVKTTDPANGVLISKQGLWSFYLSTNQLRLDINDLISGLSTIPLPVLLPGNWSNVVLVFSGGNIKLYINGGIVSNLPNPYNFGMNNNPVWIGYDGSGNYLTGSLDDVRVYNRMLTDDEIKSLRTYYPLD